MKNSIKRAQSQARLSFAERENFRPKVRQLKKTLLTLVALLAVTTGAWADETLLLTIENSDDPSFKSGSKTFDDKVTVTFSNEVYNDGDTEGWYAAGPITSLLTVAGTNGYTITSCKFYTDEGPAANGYTIEGESPSVYLYGGAVYTDASQSVYIGGSGVNKIEVYTAAPSAAPSGPEVAWTAASKTGTFTMPGGNVTLEPEYYPQATVADGGVTAADADARATTDDPLVKMDATKLTGAKKLMYFVSNSGTAPAYDAEGWTDQLPTAEGFTQQGIVYVWYYPVGTDEGVDGATATYSDGDICLQSITARIAAEPAPDLSHTLADGSYYVKNGALSLYMAAGGSWGTHGIVNERGLDLIFTYNSGTKTYTIDSRLDNGGNNHFLNSGLYMDAPSFGWTVEGENSFTISANLDGVKNYLAVDENNNLVYTEDGTAENAQWIIIPKADHENAVLAAGLDAMKAATAENGVDATFLIACPGFNRNDKRNAEAWTVEGNNLELGSGSSDGNGCAGGYNSTFTLSQTLSNAPAGVYTLTAQGFYRQNGSDNENLPYFYANDEKQTFKLLEDQVYNTAGAGPVFTQGKYTIDPITVVVAEDGALTIGAKLETNTYNMLSCWDNFKLTYYGPVMYAVTFADDTAEPDKWTASPNTDVKKGQTVTVTYTGSKKVIGVKAEKKAAAPATPLDNTMTAWTAGKYAVPAGGLTYSAAITVSGDVTLVLTDGETLTLNKGISLAAGATLTIEGNGTMNVNGTDNSTASTVAGTGTLVLTSGTLNAKGGNGQSMIINSDGGEADFNTGASGGVAINGNVTVNGGTVTATGGNGGNLTITGEDDVMDDHGGNGGAAISGSVTVNTGTWTATNGSNGILTLNSETEPDDGNSAGIGGKAVAGNVTDNR